ncbi:MAG: hypothetical protein WDA60_03435 [Acidimicrobiia bacterium]
MTGADEQRPERPWWIVWHPHQKLWNWWLVHRLQRVSRRPAVTSAVVGADSLLLVLRVLLRRVVRLGPAAVLRPSLPLPARVLYVDCGLHRGGLQVATVRHWLGDRTDLSVLGFEASPEHFPVVQAAYADAPVDFRNVALVGPDHPSDVVRLYRSGGSGKADSLFAERGEEFDTVPAVRLSAVLEEFFAEHGRQPLLVRMNIEGAEEFVIDDLVDSGLVEQVAGFYGMWDDLGKIDPARDAAFRRTLRAHHIHTVTFNDRDYGHRFRLWAVRYDMNTALVAAAAG